METQSENNNAGRVRVVFERITGLILNQARKTRYKNDAPVKREYNREVIRISVDLVTRHYGGPEEGGWWYDAGEVVEQHAVVVQYVNGIPYLSKLEISFLTTLAQNWLEEYEFDTSHRSSMAQRKNDYSIRAGFEPDDGWSDYYSYC